MKVGIVDYQAGNMLSVFNSIYNLGYDPIIIKESKARIKTAIKNSGFEYSLKQYTINLAPADLSKYNVLLKLFDRADIINDLI